MPDLSMESNDARRELERRERRKALGVAEAAVDSVRDRIRGMEGDAKKLWDHARTTMQSGPRVAATGILTSYRAYKLLTTKLEQKLWLGKQCLANMEEASSPNDFANALTALHKVSQIDPEKVEDVFAAAHDAPGEQIDVADFWSSRSEKEVVDGGVEEHVPTIEEMTALLEKEAEMQAGDHSTGRVEREPENRIKIPDPKTEVRTDTGQASENRLRVKAGKASREASEALARRQAAEEKSDLISRQVKTVSPAVAPKAKPFKIHLKTEKATQDRPQRESHQGSADGQDMAAEAKEEIREITVYIRSDVFEITPSAPQVIRLTSEATSRISFTAIVPEAFRDSAAEGTIVLDLFYCDERVADLSFSIPIESDSVTAEGQEESTRSFVTQLSPEEAEKHKQFIDEALLRVGRVPVDKLPSPIGIPYSQMEKSTASMEKAGWIPLVLQAFLHYHVCLADREVESERLRGRRGRLTLGVYRHGFEDLIRRSGRDSFPSYLRYVSAYCDSEYQWLLDSLMDYRNRMWGHPGMFPAEDQCALLWDVYRKKLDAFLTVLLDKCGEPRLLVTDADGHVSHYDIRSGKCADGVAGVKAHPGNVFWDTSGTYHKLSPAVVYRRCGTCAKPHLQLLTGLQPNNNGIYEVVPGSCDRLLDIADLLANPEVRYIM